jgi:hypothetical protein
MIVGYTIKFSLNGLKALTLICQNPILVIQEGFLGNNMQFTISRYKPSKSQLVNYACQLSTLIIYYNDANIARYQLSDVFERDFRYH